MTDYFKKRRKISKEAHSIMNHLEEGIVASTSSQSDNRNAFVGLTTNVETQSDLDASFDASSELQEDSSDTSAATAHVPPLHDNAMFPYRETEQCQDLHDNGDCPNDVLLDDELLQGQEAGDVIAELMNIPRNCVDLRSKLRYWAVSHNIPHSALRKLLGILQPSHPDLPLDPRTLLCTGTVKDIVPSNGGFYYHHGVKKALTTWIGVSHYNDGDIKIQINIDGLPVFRSSSVQLWPILGLVKGEVVTKPFIIGLFIGRTKPSVDFLNIFVEEMETLMANGMTVQDQHFNILISGIICDTPARCLIKQSKLYSGYHGCDKCAEPGQFNGRMTFPGISAERRTNESFRNRVHPQHHVGESPLERLNINMVDAIPIDYMHMVCLGIMKKILLLWCKGPLPTRLSANNRAAISDLLINSVKCIPSEFARKPRGFKDLEFWKATEFRMMLIYTGCVVLKNNLPKEFYDNFMLLSLSIRLLMAPTDQNISMAQELLNNFVVHFGNLYGAEALVYNVHGLVHLPQEAARHGALETFSSFPFENFLHGIKQKIRGTTNILQQVIGRFVEEDALGDVLHVQKAVAYPQLSGEHWKGPIPHEYYGYQQFSIAKLKKFVLSTKRCDQCAMIGAKVIMSENIIKGDLGTFIVYREFTKSKNYFTYPDESSKFNIHKVSHLSNELKVAAINTINKKCMLMKCGSERGDINQKYVALPLVHCL